MPICESIEACLFEEMFGDLVIGFGSVFEVQLKKLFVFAHPN